MIFSRQKVNAMRFYKCEESNNNGPAIKRVRLTRGIAITGSSPGEVQKIASSSGRADILVLLSASMSQ
jgi:hypothetical protein